MDSHSTQYIEQPIDVHTHGHRRKRSGTVLNTTRVASIGGSSVGGVAQVDRDEVYTGDVDGEMTMEHEEDGKMSVAACHNAMTTTTTSTHRH